MNYKATNDNSSFKRRLKYLMDLDDDVYGLYAISQDPLNKKISMDKQNEIIYESSKVGYELAEKVDFKESARSYIKSLDLQFIIEEKKDESDFINFGAYDSEGVITLYIGNLEESYNLLKDKNIDWISSDLLNEIILTHELFHYFEDMYPDLYTNTKKILVWEFGFLKYHSNLICPSEIAAMIYTKEVLNLDFNPAAINYLLYYSIDKKMGNQFFDNLVKLSEIK